MTDNPATENSVKALCVYPRMNNLCKALSFCLLSLSIILPHCGHIVIILPWAHRQPAFILLLSVWTVKNLELFYIDFKIDCCQKVSRFLRNFTLVWIRTAQVETIHYKENRKVSYSSFVISGGQFRHFFSHLCMWGRTIWKNIFLTTIQVI